MADSAGDDSELLDAVKRGFRLKSDAAVAGLLGMSRAAIHSVRHGKRRLGIAQRLKIVDKIGFLKLQNIIERMSSAALAERLREVSGRHAGNRGISNLARLEGMSEDGILLETAKSCLNLKTDDELAALLGVGRNVISMVRSGRTSIGPRPRLRLLQAVEPIDVEKIEEVLASTDMLIGELEKWAESHGQ